MLVENRQFAASHDRIFYDPRHGALGPRKPLVLEWIDGDQVLGSIMLAKVAPGDWRSPGSATFGGYDFDDAKNLEEFPSFDRAVRERLLALGGRSIEIWLPPMAHDEPRMSALIYEMTAAGYAIERTDLSYVRRLDDDPLGGFSRGNRRRLAKCAEQGVFARRASIDALGRIYAVIAANREAKGFPLSMRLDQVESLAATFPERIYLFEAVDGDATIAAGLCLDVGQRTLQVVYWGDLPGFGHLSPIVPLAEAILRSASENGFRLVDVGTSTIGAEPNRGLMHFKSGLGFAPSAKFRLRLELRPERG